MQLQRAQRLSAACLLAAGSFASCLLYGQNQAIVLKAARMFDGHRITDSRNGGGERFHHPGCRRGCAGSERARR